MAEEVKEVKEDRHKGVAADEEQKVKPDGQGWRLLTPPLTTIAGEKREDAEEATEQADEPPAKKQKTEVAAAEEKVEESKGKEATAA